MSNLGNKFILANRFVFDSTANLLIEQPSEQEVRLGSNESRILLMFIQKPNQIIARDELHNFVWREQGFEVDDSSLTQAISTLRKMLQDSTKQPLFIKTIPKRGYQFIAPIEQLTDTTPPSEYQSSEQPADVQSELTSNVNATHSSTKQTQSITPASENPSLIANLKQRSGLPSFLMLFIAVLLPILVFTFSSPPSSSFRQLSVVNDVLISTPTNHPDISNWLPLIQSCIKEHRLMQSNQRILKEVIATGGDNGQLTLNYIYLPQYSRNNITLRIFANSSDTDKVCQK